MKLVLYPEVYLVAWLHAVGSESVYPSLNIFSEESCFLNIFCSWFSPGHVDIWTQSIVEVNSLDPPVILHTNNACS
jgi:hypothetical protein